MFDNDFSVDDLDLGARRKPTVWVAVAPPLVYRQKQRYVTRLHLPPRF